MARKPGRKIDRRKAVTHLSRAGVGLGVTGVAVAGILVLGSFAMPTIELAPQAANIETGQSATRTLACAGAALELGADSARPLLAIPTGSATLTEHDAIGGGAKRESYTRESDSPGAGTGVLLEMAGDQTYAQALSESETSASSALKGLVTTQCIEATNESWIVGGTTTLGSVTLLSLTNPGDVDATVFVNVFDDKGPVDSLQSAGVVVPPKSQRTVSLNGAAPDRATLAVQVLSRGAKVVATMQESLVQGLNPAGVDTVQGVAQPEKELVITGITTPRVEGVATVDEHGHDEAGHTLRVLAPGDKGGIVKAFGVNAEGKRVNLISEYVKSGAVTEFALEKLTDAESTVVLESEVPIVASITGLAKGTAGVDIAWFTASPVIDREVPVAVPDAPGALISIYNPSGETVLVDLVAGDGSAAENNITLSIPAKSSVQKQVKANTGYQLLAGAPVFAALSFGGDGLISGFSIVPPLPALETVAVYTR